MKTAILLMALTLARAAGAQSADVPAALVGGRTSYEVKAGDTLGSIAARFGVARDTLVELNALVKPYALAAGQIVAIDNAHVAVAHPQAGVTINIAQRMLVFADGDRVRAYPVTVGKRTWPTPVGAFTILTKETDPVWDVPVSIQREMQQQGKPVITRMDAGPTNPLGRHWLGLSLPGLGIHGTNVPTSIYAFGSHGCIRLHPDDIADLFERVSVGMAGVLIYQPVIIAVIDDRIWVEAHPDEYRRAPDPMASVRTAAERAGLGASVDWALVEIVLKQRRGHATDVTLSR